MAHPLLDDATLREIHSGAHTDLPLCASVEVIVGTDAWRQVHVVVRDFRRREAGKLANEMSLRDGELHVRYQNVELQESFRGHGFPRSYYVALERELAARGADVITAYTWRVGGYLFAQLGFEFDLQAPNEAELTLKRHRYLRRIVEGAREAEAISQEFDWLEPSLYSPEESRPRAFASPGDVATLPGDIGWRIFNGLQWNAIKWLL